MGKLTDTLRGVRAGDGVQAWVLAVPLVLVNGLAAFGQSLWSYDEVRRYLPDHATAAVLAVALAVTLETIALVLSGIAHAARMDGDAAVPAQASAYVIAAAVGVMNWSHWSGPGWAPTGLAFVFAGFSVLSPWLWGTWSKAKHRRELRASGLIDRRAVRFSLARWLLWPRQTWEVFRKAVWAGVNDPDAAITAWTPKGVPALVSGTGVPSPEPVPVAPTSSGGVTDRIVTPSELTRDQEQAVRWVLKQRQDGRPAGVAAIKAQFHKADGWAREIRDEANRREVAGNVTPIAAGGHQ